MLDNNIGAYFGVLWTPKILLIAIVVCVIGLVTSDVFGAIAGHNIHFYKDTLSDSHPSEFSNHTLDFTLYTDIAASGFFELTPPAGFEILSTSTFGFRNVELYVNGSARLSTSTLDGTYDQVIITPGTPGLIRYNLNTTTGVSSGDNLSFRIGNHTTNSAIPISTPSTTIAADIGIKNSSVLGEHQFNLTSGGGTEPAYADFIIFLLENMSVGPIDTTETVPPFRFNGAPAGDVGGTTLSVEMSLETDEFAICKYSTVASTTYAAMADTFTNTGFTSVVHSTVISGLVNNTTYNYYVRCLDDEGNFNIDDYLITFRILDVPGGTPNTEGSNDGTGTGSGDDGSGSGGGGGGTSGSSDGGANTSGGSSGPGGSGGGSGGTSGPISDDVTGGGFEDAAGPYQSGDGRVIITGFAFPRNDVIVLVDGFKADTKKADRAGEFSITVDEIARGVYTFGIYAVDGNGIKSTTFSTTFTVTGARTTNLGNINIMPSILVDPDPVNSGETLTVRGFSIPDATITIENSKENAKTSIKTFTTTSDGSGEWSLDINTDRFSDGTYKIRAKAEQTDGVKTDYSDYTFYGVGQEADIPLNSDLNRDGKVNLVDFSILLFWWGGAGGDSDPPADINRDGIVQLTDFSIMLFNWTG